MKDPKDSDRVSVAISKSNSKHYYVQGAVAIPGRCTITGLETVLDAIHVAEDWRQTPITTRCTSIVMMRAEDLCSRSRLMSIRS